MPAGVPETRRSIPVQALEITPNQRIVWALRAWGNPVLDEPGAPEAVQFGDLK